ncbi:gluconokinase [Brevibacterium sanguinis]|uniref:Gluconokinase n=2 Tax=Brevibacterium TaxID=1696 RepID=A0A366INK7_9MICO|nr:MULTISPECIES: gluconokinase [Brevibacterium]RBP68154.1 gluconokinase [Brevibacterium sanguinis]RBP74429.1 gluconokinase [Brevibacterium celere]
MEHGARQRFASLPPFIVMGVSGTGKTTVGQLLAAELGIEFLDGDDLHSAANKAKMASGTPLDDDDRWPWLRAVALHLGSDSPPVIACSALKRAYRDYLRARVPQAFFIHLTGAKEKIVEHLAFRSHEFMSPTLVDSQLSTLEPLDPDEAHLIAPIDVPPDEVCRTILAKLAESLPEATATTDADPEAAATTDATDSDRSPTHRPHADH